MNADKLISVNDYEWLRRLESRIKIDQLGSSSHYLLVASRVFLVTNILGPPPSELKEKV
jgi:hypothetical protein